MPPEVEVEDIAKSTEVNVDSISTVLESDNELEEKAHETTNNERGLLDDVYDNIHGTATETRGQMGNSNCGTDAATVTSTPTPLGPWIGDAEFKSSRSKRVRTETPPGSDSALHNTRPSKPAGKKPKLVSPLTTMPLLRTPSLSVDPIKAMLIEAKSEILLGIEKHHTPSNKVLNDNLKTLEARLDNMESLLQSMCRMLSTGDWREPTPARFWHKDTDENSSMAELTTENKERETSHSRGAPNPNSPNNKQTFEEPRKRHPIPMKIDNETHNTLNTTIGQPSKQHHTGTRPPFKSPENASHRASNAEKTTRPLHEPPHFNYLENEFKNTFGLPTSTGKARTISSFDGVNLAAGYSKVVITWQGMFFKLRAEDIFWGNLNREESPNSNVISWSTRGVKIFQLKKPNSSSIPYPHRFAVSPPRGFQEPCNPLSPDGYYVHVYQTMVEVNKNVWITLNSKRIARELERLCGASYLPRQPHRQLQDNIQASANQQSLQTQAHQNKPLERPFSRELAHPPNWNNRPTIQYHGYNPLSHTNTWPSQYPATNMIQHTVPLMPLQQPIQVTQPHHTSWPTSTSPPFNPHAWQSFMQPPNVQQNTAMSVRSPPFMQRVQQPQTSRAFAT